MENLTEMDVVMQTAVAYCLVVLAAYYGSLILTKRK